MKSPQGIAALGNVSGAVTLDASRAAGFTMTLVGDTTLAVKNVRPGVPCIIVVTQDLEGSRALAWNGAGGMTISGFTTVDARSSFTSGFLLFGTSAAETTAHSFANPFANPS